MIKVFGPEPVTDFTSSEFGGFIKNLEEEGYEIKDIDITQTSKNKNENVAQSSSSGFLGSSVNEYRGDEEIVKTHGIFTAVVTVEKVDKK